MKIAIIHPDFKTKGGAENIVFWVCEELSKTPNSETTIFSIDFSDWEKKFRLITGITIEKIQIPKVFQGSKLFTLIFASIYFKKKLKKFDIINPYNYPASLWVGLANILSKRKLPKIVWFCFEPARFLHKNICNSHTPENFQVEYSDLNKNLDIKFSSRIKFFIKNIYKPLLRYIDKKAVETFTSILTLSDTINMQVKTIYSMNNVHTCYMGIKNIKETSKINIQDNTKYFLTVCRLEPIKNIQKVIEAFYLLKNQNKLRDVKYYIVGRGPFENHLRALIKEYNLTEHVKLCGYKKPEELLSGSYYTNCLAYIYLPFDEPFGLPYLEAAAFSKPSIASNHGGPAELVIDEQTGLLADPANANMISEKIESMFDNRKKREQMSINAYKHYSNNFTWNQYINRYLTLMKNIK